MKSLIAIAATLFATSAFAGTQEIECQYSSNSDYQLTVNFDSETKQIVRVAMFNVDWGQNSQYSPKVIVAQADTNNGKVVTLQDGTTVQVPADAYVKDNRPEVMVNGNELYYCLTH